MKIFAILATILSVYIAFADCFIGKTGGAGVNTEIQGEIPCCYLYSGGRLVKMFNCLRRVPIVPLCGKLDDSTSMQKIRICHRRSSCNPGNQN